VQLVALRSTNKEEMNEFSRFSKWLAPLSLTERISALTRIYLRLTVNARELFVPDWTAGKEQRVLEILLGLNEIHHTLANQLAADATDEHKSYPVPALSQMLLEIERKYRLENLLTPAVEFVRTQKALVPLTPGWHGCRWQVANNAP
jgi:hypothetical protein